MPFIPGSVVAAVDLSETGEEHGYASWSFEKGRGVVRTYERRFRVAFVDQRFGQGAACQAVRELFGCELGAPYVRWTPLIPGHEGDTEAFCLSIQASPEGDEPNVWTVTASYEPLDPDTIEAIENPLLAPPEISYDGEPFERIADREAPDANGGQPRDILNSAGDPFDPAIMADDSRSIMAVEWNAASYSEEWASGWRDRVNSDVFMGRAPGTLKVRKLIGRRVWYQQANAFYWRVSLELHINADGWDRQVLDAGYHELDASGNKTRIALDDGKDPASPVPLDGEGKRAAPGSGGTIEPHYLTFRVYRRRPFAQLGI